MMVLSNAERQRRYRQRLKAAARGDDIANKVMVAIDVGLTACWEISRSTNDASFDDLNGVDDLKASLAAGKRPVEDLHEVLSGWLDGGDERQRAAIERAHAIVEAVLMTNAKKPARKGRAGAHG